MINMKRDHHQRHIDHGRVDGVDNQQENNGKGKLDESGDGTGGEKRADTIELFDIACKGPNRTGPMLQFQVKCLLEQHGRKDDVTLFGSSLQKSGSDILEHQIEQINQKNARCQHPQCVDGIVRDDPVIHVHGKKGAGHHKQIDDEGAEKYTTVYPFKFHQCAEKPAAFAGASGRAFILTEPFILPF